jgi:hypothetical protein
MNPFQADWEEASTPFSARVADFLHTVATDEAQAFLPAGALA